MTSVPTIIGVRLEPETLDYFQRIARQQGKSVRNCISDLLKDCARNCERKEAKA